MRMWSQPQPARDAGVVTVIFALCLSSFLIGFAALAIDAGTAFTRRAQLQSVADRVAIATAGGLPATAAARTDFEAAFRQACSDEQAEGNRFWDDCGGDLGWATDRDRSNGEVEFLNDTTGGLLYQLKNAVQPDPVQATAVKVTLPPSRVDFALGSFYGVDSTEVVKSATARIGTPLGAGILPFTVTRTDIANGQLCLVDPSVPAAAPAQHWPVPKPSSTSAPGLRVVRPSGAKVAFDPEGGKTHVVLRLSLNSGRYLTAQNLKVFYNTSPTKQTYLTPQVSPQLSLSGWIAYDLSFDLDQQNPGDTVSFWVTGKRSGWRGTENFTSYSTSIDFTPRPGNDQDPCSLPQAEGRGVVTLARDETATDAGTLTPNVRSGPEVQLYTPAALEQLLGTLPVVNDLCVTQTFNPSSVCLSGITTQGFSDTLRKGLLKGGDNRDGRLVGDCGQGTTSAGGTGGVDASKLLSADSPLVDTHFGTGADLRQRIVTQEPPDEGQHGWVSGKALSCPRMAVLPVVGSSASDESQASLGARSITGFVYVWIDGTGGGRGLTFSNGKLRSISAYVIDPRYLPTDVAGSGTVGPYLGSVGVGLDSTAGSLVGAVGGLVEDLTGELTGTALTTRPDAGLALPTEVTLICDPPVPTAGQQAAAPGTAGTCTQ